MQIYICVLLGGVGIGVGNWELVERKEGKKGGRGYEGREEDMKRRLGGQCMSMANEGLNHHPHAKG